MHLDEKDYFIQNDFYDDVVNNPKKYNNFEDCIQLYLAGNSHLKGYKIFDYLLIDSSINNYFHSFIGNMIHFDLLDDYIEDVKNKSNDFIKAYCTIFLEDSYFEEIFNKDVNKMVSILSSYGDYHMKERLYALIGLSDFTTTKEEIENIKKAIKYVMENDKEYTNKTTKEKREKEYKEHVDYIDEKQKIKGRGLVYEYIY